MSIRKYRNYINSKKILLDTLLDKKDLQERHSDFTANVDFPLNVFSLFTECDMERRNVIIYNVYNII